MRASIGDLELEYEVIGSGPELVLLHGLGGNLETERRVAELLSARFRVLWYSTRGCGRSTPLVDPARYGYGEMAADLDNLMDRVGFDRPLLFGGSHGANTILRHEADFPGRAKALLLVAPGANALSRPSFLRFSLAIRLPLAIARRRGPEAMVRLLLGTHPSSDDADQVSVAALRTHDLESLARAIRHIPDQRAVDPKLLAHFCVPTHVIAWDKDPIIHPLAVAKEIASLIPGATFEQIDRLVDMTAVEIAERTAEVVTGWASRIDGLRD